MSRRQNKDDESPENAAERDDAYCTECHEWYDASKQSEVNKHAH